jgi:hypothetical protein
VTRLSSLKSLGIIPPPVGYEGLGLNYATGPLALMDDEQDKISDKKMKSATMRLLSERGKTIGSGGFKSSSVKPSVIERFREKTMELRQKKFDESSFMMVKKINYKDFSP